MLNLYEYLEKLWESKYYDNYTPDEFMSEWLDSNFASTAMYEEFLDEEFLGEHHRYFKINHVKRTIEFFIEKE